MNKNGRFLFPIFGFLKLSALLGIRNLVEDEGGGGDALISRFAEDDTLDTGKASEEAPATEQVEDSEKGEGEEGKEEQESSEEQAPVVTEEDLEKALNPEESPEAEVERTKRDLAASSKEGKRLAQENKAIAEALKSQGLKLSVKDGKVDLIPTEGYSEKPAMLTAKVSDLPFDDQEALESGDLEQVQTVLDKMLAKQASTLVRANPTLAKEELSLSAERKESVFTDMESAKDVYDKPKYENFAENKKQIDSFITHPARSQALRDLFATDPELAASLVNNHINSVKATLTARVMEAQKAKTAKTKAAAEKAAVSVDNEGVSRATGDYSGGQGRSRYD